jgi:hypothetical protein
MVGITKPTSLPMRHYSEDDETWNEWYARTKRDHPIGYFLTETLPDSIDSVRRLYKTPIDNSRAYISNRYGHKIHYLPTGLQPGKYHDYDTRLLHGMFQSMVDFVEVELAGHNWGWGGKDTRQKYNMKWYYRTAPISWFTSWRCPQAGIDHLTWAMTLDQPNVDEYGNDMSSPAQAAYAKELHALYMWWIHERPTRVDNHSNITRDFYQRVSVKYPNRDIYDFAPYDEVDELELNQLHDQEHKYEQLDYEEDSEMMYRLIKIRGDMWT